MSDLHSAEIRNDQVLFVESVNGFARVHYFVEGDAYYDATWQQPFHEAVEEAERETKRGPPAFMTFSVEEPGILDMGGQGKTAFALHGKLVHEIGAYHSIRASSEFAYLKGAQFRLCELEEVPGSPLSYILFKSPTRQDLHRVCLVLPFDKNLIAHALHHVRMPARVDPKLRAHLLGAEND